MVSTNSQRPWYQFSLRTLLIVMFVFAVTVGWTGARIHRARKNRDRLTAVSEAVAAIERMGGKVTSAPEKRRNQTRLENIFDDPGSADDPVRLLNVTRVDFVLTSVTDADLEHLKVMTSLNSLRIGGVFSNVSSGTTFNYYYKGHVTNAGLTHLKGLKYLESLDLNGMNITDAALEHLNGLTNLNCLRVVSTNVTDEGVKKLKQALPNCKIHHLTGILDLQARPPTHDRPATGFSHPLTANQSPAPSSQSPSKVTNP